METKIKPLGDYVLIGNPLKGAVKELETVMATLPEKEREVYIKSYHKELFEKITILEVGEDCKLVKKGDVVITSPENLVRAFPIEDEKLLLVREQVFIGKIC